MRPIASLLVVVGAIAMATVARGGTAPSALEETDGEWGEEWNPCLGADDPSCGGGGAVEEPRVQHPTDAELVTAVQVQANRLANSWVAGRVDLRGWAYDGATSAASAIAAATGVSPRIVLVIHTNGTVLARDGDRNRLFGRDMRSTIPVARALAGEPPPGVWEWVGEGMRAVVVPIRLHTPAGLVFPVGVLLVGFEPQP